MTIAKNRYKISFLLPICSVWAVAHQSFESSYVCIVCCLDTFLGFYRLAHETNYSDNAIPKENSFELEEAA